MFKNYLSVKKFAEATHYSRPMIQKLILKGIIVAEKAEGCREYFIHQSELEKFKGHERNKDWTKRTRKVAS